MVPTTVFKEPTRKDSFFKVKKNQLSDLIKVKSCTTMFTRSRYVKLVKYIYFNFLIEFKNTKKVLLDEFLLRVMEQMFRKLFENKMIILKHVETEKSLANIFTKILDFVRFDSLWKFLRICSM